jgi:hypothetical protein
MRLSKSQTTSLLVAIGAASAIAYAPAAVADPGNTTACQAGQIVIDGQCNTAPAPNDAPASDGKAPAAGTSDQHGGHGY